MSNLSISIKMQQYREVEVSKNTLEGYFLALETLKRSGVPDDACITTSNTEVIVRSGADMHNPVPVTFRATWKEKT